MRSLAHCQALLDAFTVIETEKNDIRSPKRGYGYKPKEVLMQSTGQQRSDDYGHIPGLRGGSTTKYPDMPNYGVLSPLSTKQALDGINLLSVSASKLKNNPSALNSQQE